MYVIVAAICAVVFFALLVFAVKAIVGIVDGRED